MPCAADPNCVPSAANSISQKCVICKQDVHWDCARQIAGTRDTGNGIWLFFCSAACSGASADTVTGTTVTPVFTTEHLPPAAAPPLAQLTPPVARFDPDPTASLPPPVLGLPPPAAVAPDDALRRDRPLSAAASSAAKYRSRSVFKPEHGVRYGMAVHEKSDTDVVKAVACQFCVVFGRTRAPSSAAKKRKVSKTNKVFKHPFRTDLFQRHLMEHHGERWSGYKDLPGAEKETFFPRMLLQVQQGAQGEIVITAPLQPATAAPDAGTPDAQQPPTVAVTLPTAPAAPAVASSTPLAPAPAPPSASAPQLYLSSEEFATALAASVTQNAFKRFSTEQQLWLPLLLTTNCNDFHMPTEMLYAASPPAKTIASVLLEGRPDGKEGTEDGLFHLFVGMVEGVRSRATALEEWLGTEVKVA